MKDNLLPFIRAYLLLCIICNSLQLLGSHTIDIQVKNSIPGAPLTFGIPFARGALMSPDYIRVLDKNGEEIPSQTNLVTTWEPLDFSAKWVWIFFFSTGDEEYIVEYGSDIRKAPLVGDKIKIKNAQRKGQTSYVETGPLRFAINKKQGGFIDDILFDSKRDGFDLQDTIAVSDGTRGSFLDILDDLGIDSSSAIIQRTVRERGSGSLHAIMRLEGTYTYQREDNRDSPFTIRIHVYAGKSYIRVYHTLTYTGTPDKHALRDGQHANIATSTGPVKDDSESTDIGWTQPNDQISAVGLSLRYNLNGIQHFTSEYQTGPWYQPGESKLYKEDVVSGGYISVFQTGPKPNRIPPVPSSDSEKRIDGFSANLTSKGKPIIQVERADGWVDITGSQLGVAVGIKNFVEEYPKEIRYNQTNSEMTAYLWSPQAGPMSFARASMKRDQAMISNFAQGVTKTSELVYYFHKSDASEQDVENTMDFFLHPPVPHAEASTYSNSKVYGQFSPRQENNLGFERALDYKFEWQLFNQHWEPWYGMFDYGDQKNFYYKEDWHRWQNNEPAIDFMYWLQFMRTGDPKYYRAAEAMSRHTMDVDNVHWPVDPTYYGDTNESLDFFNHQEKESIASPYLGIGRRHANQHWAALLSAHVWLEGWLASYYLTGYHRGLDIAKLTADSYTRRFWGDHDLTGRRLYLSIWNMVEAWDATKDPKYLEDLKERIEIAINHQNGSSQYDNLVIDRYGYSQVYISHGLYKYYQLTQDEKVKQSLIRHARAVRDNPPYNHEYESYFATIHSLLVGYEFTGDRPFLDEAIHRSETLKTDELQQSFESLGNQKLIAEAMERVFNLPEKGDFATRPRFVSNWSPIQGLRVGGWTHIYNIPWLLHYLREEE